MATLNKTRCVYEVLFWMGIVFLVWGFQLGNVALLGIGGLLLVVGTCGRCGKPLFV